MLRIAYNYQSPQFYYCRQDALVWTTKGAVITVLKPVILQEL